MKEVMSVKTTPGCFFFISCISDLLLTGGMAFLLDLCTSNNTAPSIVEAPLGELFNCSIAPESEYFLQVPVGKATAVMSQFHSLRYEVLMYDTLTRDSIRGHHEGMLRYPKRNESLVTLSVRSTSVNHTANVLMMITLFQLNDPIPGACNQIFRPENEPNLHLNATPDLALIEFAPANAGSAKGEDPPVCDKKETSSAMRLLHHLYVYYMPTKGYSERVMFDAVEKMSTPKAIEKHGQKVTTFTKSSKREVYMALFKNRGIIYNIISSDPVLNTSSAYVPFVTYSCDEKLRGSYVCAYTDMGPTLMYTFCGLFGVILCFLGHWTFLYEMFMFGFLPSVICFYMIFTASTDLYPYGIFTASITLGALGGAVLMGLWWRFGKVMPTILWISVVLGFQLTAVLFFTPFGYLDAWENKTAFGFALASGILVVPIFGLLFQKWVSCIACAVIGSYMMISTMSFFLGGILQYIIQNIVHRASTDNFDKAIFVLPKDPVDYVLSSLWVLFVFGGVVTQKCLTRNESDFPSCPYKSFKERRILLRMNSSQARERIVNFSDEERTPLVGDL